MGTRRWIAWKLVQLAYRIHNTEYYERIYLTNAEGKEVWEAVILGDGYGGGVRSIVGGETKELPEGYAVHWDDDYQPEWLEDEE